MEDGDRLHVVTADHISDQRRRLGKTLVWGSAALMALIMALQTLDGIGTLSIGFENWRPSLYAYLFWSTCLCVSQVLIRGEHGKRTLFVLPAALFVISMVVFPLLFGLIIAFSDWNLSSPDGRQFNGIDNLRQMAGDPFYWNAMRNMVWYTAAIVVEYAIAFGLALLLNGQIRARKFFRVAFLLPLMLSPVAVSWMIGKSMLEIRFGPISRFMRYIASEPSADLPAPLFWIGSHISDFGQWLGWASPSFFGSAGVARAMIMMMDAWTFIPFMMIMILAGLQAIPRELFEAAEVDGASKWRQFWEVTFPLMLPVSITAILIRIIFKLKLADIIINITSGGPGGATDSVTSFIFREYRDRSNVGYGTLLAIVYLVVIVIAMTILMKLADRWMKPRY
ncbi:sugar ABC transporter permease [Roseovarius sp. 10]|jgi:multiple sugar transport system permease protein|uniref:carbohydrate ABC transporter permease n=1 Tax=Roseovarius sp. 10 TaxID=3080563 RepID=UPI002952DB20|nr:sugar ABC transporter permease [Roseovarius sp. 10]MDV7200116.1 sugar ABC transporter permease [Roseovarius sp. 10]